MSLRNGMIVAWLALGLAACQAAAPPSPKAQARTVSVARIELRPIAGSLTTSGVLTPRNVVNVAPDVSGYRVSRVLVEEGDWVRAGQPLAEMDSSILRAQLGQQVALLAEQRATADQKQAEARRVIGLDSEGVLSQEQVDDRRFAAATAMAAANAQKAAVEETRTRLGHLVVRAPVSGLIIERTVRAGDISGGASTPWFRMADQGEIELWADLSEGDFALVHPGLAARVTLADQQTVQGKVRLVGPRVDAATRLGTVRIGLPVRPDIRAGGYAQASFFDITRAVPSAPETAVRYDANGASVMTVGADGKVSEVPVRTGQRGGGYVELLSGPPAGAIVVAKAAAQLLPGDYVKPDWSSTDASSR